jgi:hypothetical protein
MESPKINAAKNLMRDLDLRDLKICWHAAKATNLSVILLIHERSVQKIVQLFLKIVLDICKTLSFHCHCRM